MPRVTTIQDNFTAGELSPRLHGRVALEPYVNGAELMENCIPLIHGGVRRRDGTRFVVEVKESAKIGRLIPFVFSETEAFVLEMGDQYIRFIKDGVQVAGPYELATNIGTGRLFDFDYAQSADTMAITHREIFPARLRRFADDNWLYDPIPFLVQPFAEIGDSFANTLTLSAATVGAGRTATASGATFLNGDVGRTIAYQGGFATITGFTSATVVTITISSAFASVNIPASLWTLGLSPQESITPGVETPVETSTTLTSPALNIWRTTDVGKFVHINGGIMLITGFTSATVVQATIKRVLVGITAAPKNSWSLEASVWGGLNGFPRTCTFYQQRFMLAGSPAFPQTVWGSAIGAYLDFLLGALDDDAVSYTIASDQINPILHLMATKVLFALTYGGEFTLRGGVEKPLTPTNVQADPQTAYGCSRVRPLRFDKQVLFAQRVGAKLRAITYDVDTGDYNAPDLAVMSEHITQPSIVDLTSGIDPDPLVYAPRSDGQLATVSLSESQNVVALARQLTDGIIESACTVPSATGDQTYLLVRRVIDGATVRYIERLDPSMVYSLDSAVVASVATPSSVNVSAVRLVQVGGPFSNLYQRFIDTAAGHGLAVGAPITVSGVEATKFYDINGDHVVFGVPTPTSIQLTSVTISGSPGSHLSGGLVEYGGAGTAVWSVPHLIGKTVDCVADGYYMGQFVVDGAGEITLPRVAYRTVIGLPFRHRVKLLTPEIQTGTGSAQGNSMRTSEVTANFLDTYTTDVNETTVPFASFGGSLLGQPPQAFTGNKSLELLGWERGSSDLELGSSLPFPWHLRYVTRKFQVND